MSEMQCEKSPTILILDDPALVNTEKRLCRKVMPDSNIFVSCSIKEADEIIQTKQIDLILMDLFTDHEQEPEVQPFLTKLKKTSAVRIIGISGTFISHEHAANLDKVLMKPFSIHDLKRVMTNSMLEDE
ncbi:MAG: hypothetical protein ACTSWC_13865 [Promethearchaeota archaeon]